MRAFSEQVRDVNSMDEMREELLIDRRRCGFSVEEGTLHGKEEI